MFTHNICSDQFPHERKIILIIDITIFHKAQIFLSDYLLYSGWHFVSEQSSFFSFMYELGQLY